MYLTLESTRTLNEIISELNSIENETERKQFLNEHTEDTAFFLDTIKKINKKNIPTNRHQKKPKNKQTDIKTNLYAENEIYAILCQKNNEAMLKEYSLSDLKNMYTSIYKKTPTSSYTKEKLINVLRHRMHTMQRADAFVSLAEERK